MNTEMTVTKTQALTAGPPSPANNPYLKAASEIGDSGKLLKFVKGKWEIGETTMPEETEFAADVKNLLRGWVRFNSGKVTEHRLGKVADGFELPSRQSLPDSDPAAWIEKDTNGNPRDPWVAQWYLPLMDIETGDILTFVTGSRGGEIAIGKLLRAFGNKPDDGRMPIVALRTETYKHSKYGRIDTPILAVVGWAGTAPPVVPSNATSSDDSAAVPF
jgi:hypothetical protein